jgi:hypothetical protein
LEGYQKAVPNLIIYDDNATLQKRVLELTEKHEEQNFVIED